QPSTLGLIFNSSAPNPITPAAKSPPIKPDFAKARKLKLYKPGASNYDDLLPPNYIDLVPKEALEQFKSESEKFDWAKIPEWVPPKELR
ncbi:hypothetical protein BD310DRAFT_819097, partial [Dichomitus squalens]